MDIHEMRRLRRRGLSYEAIAIRAGQSVGTVFAKIKRMPESVESSLNRVTRWVAHNGGCSTRSGMVPMSMPRVSMLERPA